MHNNRSEQKAIRTVRRKKIQDLLAVLFFLLLLPYTCSVLTAEPKGEPILETAAEGISTRYILWERENGVWKIPEEEFLIGALAGSIPGYYREETLKAQAVILRSISLSDGGNTKGQAGIPLEAAVTALDSEGISYLDKEARRALWQENFEEFEEKFTRAVQATAGIVLMYEEQVIRVPYFRLSAGQTRDSAQIWEEKQMPWCRSVSCPHNLEADDYLQTVTVKRSDFLKTMEEQEILLPEKGVRMILTRDSAGYVLFVECGGEKIEGERFRMLFKLASSHFSIQESQNELLFTTKGIGHGLGFDQYAADLLAGAGQDYQELLYTFLKGVTLEKVE